MCCLFVFDQLVARNMHKLYVRARLSEPFNVVIQLRSLELTCMERRGVRVSIFSQSYLISSMYLYIGTYKRYIHAFLLSVFLRCVE